MLKVMPQRLEIYGEDFVQFTIYSMVETDYLNTALKINWYLYKNVLDLKSYIQDKIFVLFR